MSKERLAPCIYYVCKGKCDKGRNAERLGAHHGYRVCPYNQGHKGRAV